MIITEIKGEETWGIRHAVMWPDKPVQFVRLEEDASGTHYGVYYKHQLTTVISCFIMGDSMQFRKFATLHEFQGMGLGASLLRYVIKTASAWHIERLWCNARLDKAPYYEKFGFAKTGLPFEREDITFITMEMNPGKSGEHV